MNRALLLAIALIAVPTAALSLLQWAHHPLALLFEVRARRAAAEPPRDRRLRSVSVVVPAFDEGRVLATCVESILRDTHPCTQVVLVDDGSTDDTLDVMRRYEVVPDVVVVSQPNGGKATALNTGIGVATGEVLLFCDADGVFTPGTVRELLVPFDDPRVGAVCGNDEPVNLDRVQTRVLALLTHGTSMVRRALSLAGCLTIVSGNVGAFRRTVIDEVGLFTPGLVGEDLELTWRVQRAGWRVAFRPRAKVFAEVPDTVGALWRQRVRWTRGLVQTARMHRDLPFSTRHGRLGAYLPFNLASMLVLPVAQVLTLGLGLTAVLLGLVPAAPGTVLGLGVLSVVLSAAEIGYAVVLDRAWRDLRLLVLVPLLPLFSWLMSAVVVWSLVLEARGAPSPWNKLTRSGVISRTEVLDRL